MRVASAAISETATSPAAGSICRRFVYSARERPAASARLADGRRRIRLRPARPDSPDRQGAGGGSTEPRGSASWTALRPLTHTVVSLPASGWRRSSPTTRRVSREADRAARAEQCAVECVLINRLDDERWEALIHPGRLRPGANVIFDGVRPITANSRAALSAGASSGCGRQTDRVGTRWTRSATCRCRYIKRDVVPIASVADRVRPCPRSAAAPTLGSTSAARCSLSSPAAASTWTSRYTSAAGRSSRCGSIASRIMLDRRCENQRARGGRQHRLAIAPRRTVRTTTAERSKAAA